MEGHLRGLESSPAAAAVGWELYVNEVAELRHSTRNLSFLLSSLLPSPFELVAEEAAAAWPALRAWVPPTYTRSSTEAGTLTLDHLLRQAYLH